MAACERHARSSLETEYNRRIMSHQNPSDDQLTRLLTDAKTIAVVGLSGNPEKDSYGIARKLQKDGYRIIPINPRESEILGERSYPSLVDVPVHIDVVDVFRKAEDVPAIADEAIKIGAKALWMQAGIVSEEAAERASKAGLTVVMDACISATHTFLRIPKK